MPLAIAQHPLLPSANWTASASAEIGLTRLHHAAYVLPVYASQRRLPGRHATLGSRCWLGFVGRVQFAGLHKEVSGYVIVFPLLQVSQRTQLVLRSRTLIP